jgi:hypothetical protein
VSQTLFYRSVSEVLFAITLLNMSLLIQLVEPIIFIRRVDLLWLLGRTTAQAIV